VIVLIIAAILGTLGPNDGEAGPFLSIEQAALPQTVPNHHRIQAFAWFNLVGSFAKALGALAGGGLVQILAWCDIAPLAPYRSVVIGYALLGMVLGVLLSCMSAAIEVKRFQHDQPAQRDKSKAGWPDGIRRSWIGLHRSRGVVGTLAALFMLDAFGG
jgi:hypothetical protein